MKITNCKVIIVLCCGMLLPYLFATREINPAHAAGRETESPGTYIPGNTTTAVKQSVQETYPAVGTIKPISEIVIASQISAQVEQVHVTAGDTVSQGDRLVTLDSRQPASRLDLAKEALNASRAGKKQALQQIKAAEAAFKEAQLKLNRIKTFFDGEAATQQELESAESTFHRAGADLSRAREKSLEAGASIRQAESVVKQADVGLGFAVIKAPASGEVLKRLVEPGDMALPGKALISLRTRNGFRIEVHIPEGLINKIGIGLAVNAEIPTLNTVCKAVVEEIVPYADPGTRTFLVKASLPVIPGLYPGMYGKLMIPESKADAVLIPMAAVIRTGQLEQVMVKVKGGWHRRYIKTGKQHGILVEVLSGVNDGEIIGIPEAD